MHDIVIIGGGAAGLTSAIYALRAGMKTVVLPEKNMKDLHDVPKTVRAELKIVPVRHMDQVIEVALAREAAVEPPRPRKRSDEAADARSDEPAGKE